MQQFSLAVGGLLHSRACLPPSELAATSNSMPYTSTPTRLHTCLHAHMPPYLHAHTWAYTPLRLRASTPTHLHALMPTHGHTGMHACTPSIPLCLHAHTYYCSACGEPDVI